MSSVHKGMILAAGRGTRMGALTSELPKPMLPIEGTPMIEHIVRRMREAGIDKILIVVGYRRELIENHFAGFPGVSFVVQEQADGTAKAVQLGRDFVGKDSFILTFGDIICAHGNYQAIGDLLNAQAAVAAIGVKSVDDPWQGAAVYADTSGKVTRMIEKPPRGTSSTHWNSAGLYAFAAEIFEEIARVPRSARGEYEITSAIAQLIEAGRPVRLFEVQGAWRDVGRPDDLEHADEDLKSSANE